MAMIWIKSRFIGEESTAGGVKCELSKEPTWIIDPIGFHPHKSPKLLGVSYFQWWILTKRKMVKNITFRWDDQLHPQQPQHLHHPRLHGGKGQTSSSLNILIIRTIRIINKFNNILLISASWILHCAQPNPQSNLDCSKRPGCFLWRKED